MTSDNIAIRVRNLGKQYRLCGPQDKYLMLRDAISQFVEGAVQAIQPGSTRRRILERSKDMQPYDRKMVLFVSHNMRCNTLELTSYLL